MLEICKICGGEIKGYSSIPRIYHKECDLQRRKEEKIERKARLKMFKKLNIKDKEAIKFINNNLVNITNLQLKDICSYYGANFEIVKDWTKS